MAPYISSVSLSNNAGPSQWIARAGFTLTLSFSVRDDAELADGTPPAGFLVSVGPAGSAPTTYESASNIDFGTISRSFSYSWRVPTLPSFTRVGYFIRVVDGAGNFRNISAEGAVHLGRSASFPWSCRCHFWYSRCCVLLTAHAVNDVDVVPPTITSFNLFSNGPNSAVARGGSVLTLSFTMTDENEMPSGTPPASFVVQIGPPGSVAPTYSSVSPNSGLTRTYTYTWSVPAMPTFSRVGYWLNVSDAAGNWRTFNTDTWLPIGRTVAVMLSHISRAG